MTRYLFLILSLVFIHCSKPPVAGTHEADLPKKSSEEAKIQARLCQGQNLKACDKLGLMYFYGTHGVIKDISKGRNIWKKACDAGYKKSCTNFRSAYPPPSSFEGLKSGVDHFIKTNILAIRDGTLIVPSYEPLDEEILKKILEHPLVVSIHNVSLFDHNLSASTIKTLLESPKIQNLQSLQLGFNPIGDEGIKTLAASPKLSTIKYLYFAKTNITYLGLNYLARSTFVPTFQMIQLGSDRIDDGSVAVLSSLKSSSMDLSFSKISGKGACQLLEKAQTETLNLSSNPIGRTGLKCLTGLSLVINQLDLSKTGINSNDVKALIKHAETHLIGLNLKYNPIGDDGILALLNSKKLSNLRYLDVIGTKSSPQVRKQLIDAWGKRKGLVVQTQNL